MIWIQVIADQIEALDEVQTEEDLAEVVHQLEEHHQEVEEECGKEIQITMKRKRIQNLGINFKLKIWM